MAEKKQINKEIEKTLACFGDDPPLEAGPQFTNQTMIRIRGATSSTKSEGAWTTLWPVLRPAFVILIVLLNIATGYFVYQRPKSSSTDRDSYLSAFSEEYSLSDVSHIGAMTE